MSIRYSIIIPHYNTPELLVRCLRSIPRRGDVEVIVVDDCSPCGITALRSIDELQQPGITLLQTSQGGSAGRARNVGLQQAQGVWCLFADADDYYAPGWLDVIDAALGADSDTAQHLDVLYFNVGGEGKRAQVHRQMFERYRHEGDDAEVRFHIWAPWNKVIARRLIEDYSLCFEEIPVGNDAMFGLNVSHRAARYRIIDDCLYCLTDNEGSLTFRRPSFAREMDYTRVHIRITRFMEQHGLGLRYGYHVFSIARFRRFCKEYGVLNALRYAGHVSWHYGLVRALLYNRRRKAYQASHPDRIYCD